AAQLELDAIALERVAVLEGVILVGAALCAASHHDLPRWRGLHELESNPEGDDEDRDGRQHEAPEVAMAPGSGERLGYPDHAAPRGDSSGERGARSTGPLPSDQLFNAPSLIHWRMTLMVPWSRKGPPRGILWPTGGVASSSLWMIRLL